MFGIPCHHHHQPSDHIDVNLELKRLKLVVSDIKTQNAELLHLLSNISTTMKQMSSNYVTELKMRDYEIDTLKAKLQESENNYYETYESSEINDSEETIEIENTQAEVTSDVENNIERYNSSCSSSSVPGTDISSLKSQSSDNNTTILTNDEKAQIDRQNFNNPNIDEWTVVTKKQKDRADSKTVQRKEVTYPPGLEVANGWTHLHLYNVKLGTPEKTVLKYIKSLCGYPNCTVVALKTRAEYASFKIGVPVELAEKILKSENWTGNIRIKPWKFNAPPRKVLQKVSTENSKTDEKCKTQTSTETLPKNDVKSTSSVNPKTDEKDKTPNQNQKDLKSKKSTPKKKSV